VSSCAALNLEAAAKGLAIKRLAIYEPPFVVDDSRPPVPDDMSSHIAALVASNRRGAAIKVFMRQGVRVPPPFVVMMPFFPAWPKRKALAHTLPYDLAIVHPQPVE
jgi:hypothetical protein